MKLGIIGGTFNPIHIAHLRIAEEVRDRLGLDRVIFMPAAAPPHEPLAGELSFVRRYVMVELAVADNPDFSVSDLEGKRGGTSYSIHTLTELRALHPEDELFFIIGSDSFLEIASWYRFAELFARCNIVVVERPGGKIHDLMAALPAAIAGEFESHQGGERLIHRSGFSVHYHPDGGLYVSDLVSIEDAAECPNCHQPLQPCPDIVDGAIDLAVRTHCAVEHVYGATALRDQGRIGALLRFQTP